MGIFTALLPKSGRFSFDRAHFLENFDPDYLRDSGNPAGDLSLLFHNAPQNIFLSWSSSSKTFSLRTHLKMCVHMCARFFLQNQQHEIQAYVHL